jgi:hypothetical protein
MTFVLSQDNEIILGTKVCEALGDEMCEELIEWANARIRSLVWSERMENKTGGRIGEIN